MRIRTISAVSGLAACLLLAGCATPTTLHLDPAKCETVLVYPIFDGRKNRGINIEDLGGWNQKAHPISDYYMGKNFNCIARFASDTGVEPNIAYADLQSMNVERLKTTRTKGENYVLAFYLSELGYGAANATAYASMEAFLVRVDTGRVIWSNAAKKTQWLGLLGSLDRLLGARGDPAFEVYGEALNKVMQGFPVLHKE